MKVDTTVLGLDAQRAQEEPFIASMGIYVFNARKMIELLTDMEMYSQCSRDR